jgi:glutathione-specific gamma-glutamylcyclotransferase
MWVFGYGSLVWDAWETEIGCLRKVAAELPGFRRTFQKASVKNWGSAQSPCPTLNLIADPTRICKGIAFEFPEEKRESVINYLQRREGKGFLFQQAEIRLENGDAVKAIVAIYSGNKVLSRKSSDELVSMARRAEGANGKCVDYVRNIAIKLGELGIADPDVDEFWRSVK